MKRPVRKPHSMLAAFVLAACTPNLFALTVPVAQDTCSAPTGKVTGAAGNGVTLTVSAKQTTLLRFDLSDLNAVPAQFTPANIKSAILRLYVVSSKFPAPVTVHAVTSDWSEHFVGPGINLPAIAGGSVATIPAADLLAKSFVNVDVTAAVSAALQSGNDFGFALETAAPNARLVFSSKEGAATGYAAELEIEANVNTDATGALMATDGIFANSLAVSSVFTVEDRPNHDPTVPDSNLFIGHNAGLADTSGSNNIFLGLDSGAQNTTGGLNTFVGAGAGKGNTNGNYNSYFGFQAGLALSGGSANTIMGAYAGNTGSGSYNVLLGVDAGRLNNSSTNTFVGAEAGSVNTVGTGNVYVGYGAGYNNVDGSQNVFVGKNAGAGNKASNNTFVGFGAGQANVTGFQNTFFGVNAGNLTTNHYNSFFGAGAGQQNTDGLGNTSMGNVAGYNNTTGSNNTFLGGNSGNSITTENKNTFVGDSADGAAGVTNATALGQGAKVTISNAVVLGNNCRVGVGTSAPNSMLQVNGSLSLPVRTSNVALAGLGDSDYVLINTANGAGIQLPSAVGNTGRIYVIKNRAGNAATLGTSPPTQTIDGATTLSIAVGATAYVISDGANWFKTN